MAVNPIPRRSTLWAVPLLLSFGLPGLDAHAADKGADSASQKSQAEPEWDMRFSIHGLMVSESDSPDLSAEEQERTGSLLFGGDARLRRKAPGWRFEGRLRERKDLSDLGSQGPRNVGGGKLELPYLFATMEEVAGVADLTVGRFHSPEGLSYAIIDGLRASFSLAEGLEFSAFAGLRPRSWELFSANTSLSDLDPKLSEDLASAATRTVGASASYQQGRDLSLTATASWGGRQVLKAGQRLTEDSLSAAASARYQPLDSVALRGGVQVSDRIELDVHNGQASEARASFGVDSERIAFGLSTAYLGARVRPNKKLRLDLSWQRMQAFAYAAPSEDDAFHDLALRSNLRLGKRATLTTRYRHRFRGDSADIGDDDRVSAHLSLDHALHPHLLLSAGAHYERGDGYEKTLSSGELGWSASLAGGSKLLEVVATFTWIRRNNERGQDTGYAAAVLADRDDPTTSFAYAWAPNRGVGGRVSYLDGAFFAFVEASSDLVSEQISAFLIAGYHIR